MGEKIGPKDNRVKDVPEGGNAIDRQIEALDQALDELRKRLMNERNEFEDEEYIAVFLKGAKE